MLGSFQQSELRIEVDASAALLRESLTLRAQMQQWLWPQILSAGMADRLYSGLRFTSQIGGIALDHEVKIAESNRLLFILSRGIDGYHEWYWGDGWVQSRLEGISLLPLKISQTFILLRLRMFLQGQDQS